MKNNNVTGVAYVSSRIYILFLKSYVTTVPVGKNSYFSMGQVFRTYWGIHSIYLCRKDLPKWENFASSNLFLNM
jgi:hypothetical protein